MRSSIVSRACAWFVGAVAPAPGEDSGRNESDRYDRHTAAEARRDPAQGLVGWRGERPQPGAWVAANIDERFAYHRLPREHRNHLESATMLERLNQEIERRPLLVGHFPEEPSCLRLPSAAASREEGEVLAFGGSGGTRWSATRLTAV